MTVPKFKEGKEEVTVFHIIKSVNNMLSAYNYACEFIVLPHFINKLPTL